MRDDPDSAIRAILSDQETAWGCGDAADFSKHMAGDVLATNLQGQDMSGLDAFNRNHAFIFESFFKGSRMQQAVSAMRYLSPTTVLVETIVHISDMTDPPPALSLDATGRLETRLLQVLNKSGDRWVVVAFHNTMVNHRAPPIP